MTNRTDDGGGLPVGERPVLLLAADRPAAEVLRSALLVAPGAWDASPAFEQWAAAVATGGHPDRDQLATDLRARRDEVDWSRVPGDATPRMIAGGELLPAALSVLCELLPDVVLVHLHRHPDEVLADEDDPVAGGRRWLAATETILDATADLSGRQATVITVDALRAEPDRELQRLLGELGLGWHRGVSTRWVEGARGLRPVRPDGGAPVDDPELAERLQATHRQVQELVPDPVPSLLPMTEGGA